MQPFYKLIQIDTSKMQFYVECFLCGKRHYGKHLPIICRNRKKLIAYEQGEGPALWQKSFNHAKALSVQYLARYYNRCNNCFRWICDDCFHSNHADGICLDCSKIQNEIKHI